MKNKRGVSAVIVTVLLVLIGFLAVGLMWGIILPLVKESLGKGKSCFELRDYITILESQYTCYTSENTSLMIERGHENFSIKGVVVSVISGGSSVRYNVFQATSISDIWMRNKTTNAAESIIELPLPGEARTYIFATGGDKVEIGIIQENDKICKADTYNIPDCSGVVG